MASAYHEYMADVLAGAFVTSGKIRKLCRILSERGHLSNADCAAFARTLAESGTRQIVLAHLSRENNTPQKALEEARRALEGLPAALYCAPALGCLSLEVKKSWED